jgi:hypothetical protein
MAATSDISSACCATFEAHKARVGGGIAVLELPVALSFKQVATCLCSASFFLFSLVIPADVMFQCFGVVCLEGFLIY